MRAFGRVFFPVVVLGFLVAPGEADAKLGGSGGSAAFHARATPGDLAIDGTTGDVTVSDDGTNVTVLVQLGNITTGIALRDRHTKKYLEASKFGSAQLQVPRASLNFNGGSGDTSGALTIHGKTKQAPFHYTATKNGTSFAVKGNAHIKLTDYGIDVPSYLGVTVKDDVDIEVSFTAVDA